MPDTDDRAIEVMARAIEAAQLKWKAENGGDDASCTECPDEVLARAAYEAYQRHVQETLDSVSVKVEERN